MSARHPYGQPFEFRPQFKLVLVGNHAPALKGRSEAMERRLRVIPFTHKPAVKDPDLKAKLRTEYPAIFRWALDGCLNWQRNKLGTCSAVAGATGVYFEERDVFGAWLAERCDIYPAARETPAALLADYNGFAKAAGQPGVSANEFAETVERAPGLTRRKSNGMRWIVGIRLRTVGNAASEFSDINLDMAGTARGSHTPTPHARAHTRLSKVG